MPYNIRKDLGLNPKYDVEIGDRLMVFDSSLFKDDISTPISTTMKPCTVLDRCMIESWYVMSYEEAKRYDCVYISDMIEVQFDHKDKPSRHFTDAFYKNKIL